MKEGTSAGQGLNFLQGNNRDKQNKDIVLYYFIALAFLELIVAAVAFFYGVIHAQPLEPGGPKMASFPWLGWLVAATLSPAALLLLLHLSGWYFEGNTAGTGNEKVEEPEIPGVLPENVARIYRIARHAPTVVVLLGLIVLGGTLLFLDSAFEAVGRIGSALGPYIPWLVGGAVVFLVVCYVARLFFLARHHKMEQEYNYRLKVLETTGIILADKNCALFKASDLQSLASGGEVQALPSKPKPEEDIEDADCKQINGE